MSSTVEENVFVRCVPGLSAFRLDALGDMPAPISCILSWKDVDSTLVNASLGRALSEFNAIAIYVSVTYALKVGISCVSV